MLGTLQHTEDSLISETDKPLNINLQPVIALVKERFPQSGADLIAFLSSDPGADAYETALKILIGNLNEVTPESAESIWQLIATYSDLRRAELRLPTVADVIAYYAAKDITPETLQQAAAVQPDSSES